jgi:hypothetical protein
MGAPGTAPTEAARPPALPILLKIGGASALALAIAAVLPRDLGGDAPPVGLLLQVAAAVIAVCAAALWLVLRHDLRLPAAVAVYVVLFNALVLVTKLVLGPVGLYEVNRARDLTYQFGTAVDLTLSSLFVLALYLAVYVLLYRLARRGLRKRLASAARRRPALTRGLVLWLVAGAFVLVGVFGGGFLILLVLVLGGIEYVSFVLASGVGVLVALTLAAATGLAAVAFRDVAARAAVVGDAALLGTFFWIGLAFLVLYHVLWVVYLLVLVAIWPLRTVVPK